VPTQRAAGQLSPLIYSRVSPTPTSLNEALELCGHQNSLATPISLASLTFFSSSHLGANYYSACLRARQGKRRQRRPGKQSELWTIGINLGSSALLSPRGAFKGQLGELVGLRTRTPGWPLISTRGGHLNRRAEQAPRRINGGGHATREPLSAFGKLMISTGVQLARSRPQTPGARRLKRRGRDCR